MLLHFHVFVDSLDSVVVNGGMGKPLSAATCLEFLVKSEELTTPTRVPKACGAASAGLEGFHWADVSAGDVSSFCYCLSELP